MLRRAFVGVLILLGLMSQSSVLAQQRPWRDYPLTLTTAIARLQGESPFEADDWLIEIGEYSPETETFKIQMPLWGVGAIAYPRWASAVRWSFRGDWLALTLYGRDQTAGIQIYHLAEKQLKTVLPSEYAEVSPMSWAQDTSFGVVAADGIIYKIVFPDMTLEVLAEGRFPGLIDDDQTLIFLNTDDQISFLDLETQTLEFWDEKYENVSSLAVSPDGAWVALTQGAYLTLIERIKALPYRIFDGEIQLEAADATLDSVAWSPNSQQLAFTVTSIEAGRSQVVEIHRVYEQNRVLIETSPDDLRIFIGVSYQMQGAFIPPRENSDDV